MSDTINASSKFASESVNKSPPSFGKIDIYNESEKEWIVQLSPPNFKTFKMNDKIETFQEKSTSKCLSVKEITLINDDKNNKSEEKIFKSKATLTKNNLNSTLKEEYIVDSHSYCNTDKACEESHGKSYCLQNNFELCENSESIGNIQYNSQTEFELVKIDESEEYKHLKPCFESDENNNTDRDIYKKSFNTKAIHSLNNKNKSNENIITNIPHRSLYKADKSEDYKKKWTPNIEAPEFVPRSMKKFQSKTNNTEQFSPLNNSTYSHFSLRGLLNYDVEQMFSEELIDYTNALKLRVLEEILEFEPSYREELEVLCQLNDGSLTDKNKKIISLRICTLIKRTEVNKTTM